MQITHRLFRNDNATVYFKLEETSRGTQYAATIKPCQRTRNIKKAFLLLEKQFVGVEKWKIELKKQD